MEFELENLVNYSNFFKLHNFQNNFKIELLPMFKIRT